MLTAQGEAAHMEAASKLSRFTNAWSNIHDFTKVMNYAVKVVIYVSYECC